MTFVQIGLKSCGNRSNGTAMMLLSGKPTEYRYASQNGGKSRTVSNLAFIDFRPTDVSAIGIFRGPPDSLRLPVIMSPQDLCGGLSGNNSLDTINRRAALHYGTFGL